MSHRCNFLGIEFVYSSPQEIEERIGAASTDNPIRIATLNPEFIIEARQNRTFRDSLKTMTDCVIDGSGLFFFLKVWRTLGKITFTPVMYPGATLVDNLFQKYRNGEKSFFLLGGPPGLTEEAKKALKKRSPAIRIVGAESGGDISLPIHLDEQLISRINSAHPDILLVGFGAPKQELWINQASTMLSVPTMIGVGGTFGFYTHKKRAPLWVRRLHLEWLQRALTESGHWKRVGKAIVLFPIYATIWIFTHVMTDSKA